MKVGYVFLVVSIPGLCLAIGFHVLSLVFAAHSATNTTLSSPTLQALEEAEVPDEITSRLRKGEMVTESSEGRELDDRQKHAVFVANREIAGRFVDAGCFSTCGIGLATAGAVLAFAGSIMGWMLLRKETVMTCAACGAVADGA